MNHQLPDSIALLARSHAAVLNALLRDLPETWTFRNEGETLGPCSMSSAI